MTSCAGTPTAVHPAGTSFVRPIRRQSGKIADIDVSDNAGVRAQQDTPPDHRRAAAGLAASERNVLQNGDVIAHPHTRADHNAGAMIEKNAAAERSGRMNADLQGVRGGVLKQQSEIPALVQPKPVGHAPGLQGDVTLAFRKTGRKPLNAGSRARSPSRSAHAASAIAGDHRRACRAASAYLSRSSPEPSHWPI